MKHFLKQLALLLFGINLLNSCSEKRVATITIVNNTTTSDTLYISQLMTEVPLAKLAIGTTNSITLPAESPQIAVAKTRGGDTSILFIYEKGAQKELVIDGLGIHSNSLADSLLNYLHQSSNQALGEYGDLIFTEGKSKQLRQVFDSLLFKRNTIIETAKLDREIKHLLLYQNKARVYNFLFFYGRMIHTLKPTNDFFNFMEQISYDDPYFKTSPQVLLYKMEISYLRQIDSLTSVADFSDYINTLIKDQDDAAFLRAFYLKELIASPQYWEKHQAIFDSKALKALLKKEAKNPYAYLFEEDSKSYFGAMEGETAYDFRAVKTDSSTFHLETIKNKLVIIDVWATWCGPCIQQKPFFHEIAEGLKDEEVVFLSVSTDASYVKWKKYIVNYAEGGNVIELYLGAASEDFKKAYNIQSIPRYIFIDRAGHIIDADMEDPGIEMLKRIKERL